MGADGCLLSGAIQDHLLGFQLMAILTGQSHISKVLILPEAPKGGMGVFCEIIKFYIELSSHFVYVLQLKYFETGYYDLGLVLRNP